jgi:hypothetical protein
MISPHDNHWHVIAMPDGFHFHYKEGGETLRSLIHDVSEAEAKLMAIGLGDSHRCGVIFSGRQ